MRFRITHTPGGQLAFQESALVAMFNREGCGFKLNCYSVRRSVAVTEGLLRCIQCAWACTDSRHANAHALIMPAGRVTASSWHSSGRAERCMASSSFREQLFLSKSLAFCLA